MAIDRSILDLLATQRAALAAVTDQQARRLLVAWARAWDEIAVSLDEATNEIIRRARNGESAVSRQITARQARRHLGSASRQLQQLIVATGVDAGGDILTIVRMGAADADALTGLQLPAGLRSSVLRTDARQLAAIVQRSTEQITARHLALSASADEAMRRELVRTLAVGDNPQVAARRMMGRARDVFDGGRNRALTIARTEQLDAYRSASMASNDANADVLKGWKWIAYLSARTCRSCLAMHGTEHSIADPGPIDHQQGRCARVPVTKSWDDLGFSGIDEPKDDTPDAEEWLKGQPEDVQRQILTNRGYDEWRAGRYPREAWTHRRSTDGWRDSRVPSIPPHAPDPGDDLPDPSAMFGSELDDEMGQLMEAGDFESPRFQALSQELDRREDPSRRTFADDARDEEEAKQAAGYGEGGRIWRRARGTGAARDLQRADYDAWVSEQYFRAEEELRGVFLTAEAEAMRIRGELDIRDLFTRKRRSLKHASPELQEWFSRNPRMSFKEWQNEARGERGWESEYG